jgi:hypothetical protein
MVLPLHGSRRARGKSDVSVQGAREVFTSPVILVSSGKPQLSHRDSLLEECGMGLFGKKKDPELEVRVETASGSFFGIGQDRATNKKIKEMKKKGWTLSGSGGRSSMLGGVLGTDDQLVFTRKKRGLFRKMLGS